MKRGRDRRKRRQTNRANRSPPTRLAHNRTGAPMITAACKRLGIEIPIIQAPMGGAVGPALAGAVSNAGGLGTLALWTADVQTLRQQVPETRALTSKPFAVNLNLEFPQQERLDA